MGERLRLNLLRKSIFDKLLIMMFTLFDSTHVFRSAFIFGIPRVEPRFPTYITSPTIISGASLLVIPSSTVRNWIVTLIWICESLPPSSSKSCGNGTVIASW